MSTLRHSLRVFRQKTLRLPRISEGAQRSSRASLPKLDALRVFVVARRQSHGVSSPLRGRSEAHRSTASTSGSLRAIQVSIMARVRPSFSRRCGLPAFLARRRGVSMVSARPAGARRGPKIASSEDDSAARSSPCAGSRVGEAPASSSGGAGARRPQCLCACDVRGLSGSTGRRRVSA